MSEIKDKLITAENLKNAYNDNKRQIGELKGDLGKLDNIIIPINETALSWEIGSFDEQGILADSIYRGRVKDFIPIKFGITYTLQGLNTYNLSIQQYDKNYNFVGAIGWLESGDYEYTPNENVAFVRFGAKSLVSATITQSNLNELDELKLTNVVNEIAEIKKKLEPTSKIINKKPKMHRTWDCIVGQDGTIIDDKLWIFFDDSVTRTVYIMDLETDQATVDVTHSLGHCNSVDYNKISDTLLVYKTNTSNQVGLILYKSPSGKTNLTLTDPDCMVIDLYNATTRLNPSASVCWGENEKIVYMIDGMYSDLSNNTLTENIKITKILLGMGDNDLSAQGYGTFVNGKSSTEYNGTCKVLKEYSGEITDTLYGSNNNGTAQGMEYDGDIFVGWGFSGHNFLQISLHDDNNTYSVAKNYYYHNTDYANGNELYLEPELVALTNDTIICGSTNGAKRTLIEFSRC